MDINIMPANSTHPAVLHCRMICLDSGGNIPAVGINLNLAELGLDKEARDENVTEEELYHITYEHIRSCDPSNNTHIMEFQYSFYPLSALVNIILLTCGIVHPPSQLPCWAQSHAVIYRDYTSDYEMTITGPSPATVLSIINNSSITNNDNFYNLFGCCWYWWRWWWVT